MRSSRAELAVLAALAIAGVALGASAFAQVGPPIRLGPPTTQAAPVPKPQTVPQPAPAEPEAATRPGPQPVAVQPAPPQQPQPSQPMQAEPVQAPPASSTASTTPGQRFDLPRTLTGIEVAPVDAIDPDSVGVLGPQDGGFAADLWRGTERAMAERLLPAIPGANGSPAMHALARRLLLTQGVAPGGPGASASLLAIRVERLIALGDTTGALDLARAAPSRAGDEGVLRGELESLFYAGDTAAACARLRAQRRDATPYLQRATAFCLAHDGDVARATMLAGLMREQASDAADPFFDLIDALGGGAAPKLDARDPTGLQLAMLRAAKAAPPSAAVASPNGAVLRALAFSADAPAETRLGAAERAYVSGMITEEDIIELYNTVGFAAARIKSPFAAAESEWGPTTRALLIRTAAAAANAAVRVKTLQRTFAIAAKKGGRDALLPISAIVVRDLDQGAIPRGFMADAVRVLFAAGDAEDAALWMQRVQTDPAAREAALELWPLAQIAAAPALGWDSAAFAAWLAAARKAAPAAVDARAALLVSLCSGLGAQIPNNDWAAAMGKDAVQRAAPSPVLLRLLSHAATDKRVGETVLLSLAMIGEAGPAQAHPIALSSTLSALGAIGLDREARALAIEAALAAGL
jgi:hypothetical protein